MLKRLLMGAMVLGFFSLLCVVFLEVALTFLAPVPDPYGYLIQFNSYIRSSYPPGYRMAFTPEATLPGISGRKVLSTNNVAMRGPHLGIPKPADEYRVFLVGGGTTECGILDDSESLDAVLAAQLNEKAGLNKTVRVYNSGVSGHKSDDHIAWLAHRIVHLQPDMVVVFAGINDMPAAMVDFDYLHVDLPPFSRSVLARVHAVSDPQTPVLPLQPDLQSLGSGDHGEGWIQGQHGDEGRRARTIFSHRQAAADRCRPL
jgi:hypothetical protein